MNESVAVVGAHTVGHVHTNASGFGIDNNSASASTSDLLNAWDSTPAGFDNLYFRNIIQTKSLSRVPTFIGNL
jgi:predicted outer membrane protein